MKWGGFHKGFPPHAFPIKTHRILTPEYIFTQLANILMLSGILMTIVFSLKYLIFRRIKNQNSNVQGNIKGMILVHDDLE
jgi:hypothetical protein